MKNRIKILLTGGSGFIGTNAVDWMIKNKIKFINIDIKPPKNIEHQPYWENIDVTNYDNIFVSVEQHLFQYHFLILVLVDN